jgi:hypothetical protein
MIGEDVAIRRLRVSVYQTVLAPPSATVNGVPPIPTFGLWESAKRTVGLWDFCGTLLRSVVLCRDNCNGRPAAGFKKISIKTKR